MQASDQVECALCHQKVDRANATQLKDVHGPTRETLSKKLGPGSDESFLCAGCLQQERVAQIEKLLHRDKGELSVLEKEVVKAMADRRMLAVNPDDEMDEHVTTGERIADKVAAFGGSWAFIITFGCIILTWITINSVALLTKSFDPYPFILLNLVLSCLAALQAPVIMMSQNRQEAKDRKRSEHDFMVNLKAELEVRLLHDKMDHLLLHQMQRLMEVQELQIDLLQQIQEGKKAP
ncbi:MAG: DUF1003 domain-containing protein [Armatimonadetes bacterium]|nr:DUF1003 domain-containing protein [Armatimonadota bacterium]